MIFGFNSDVKHGDKVYHVMSEPRPDDLLLQTIVYVQGAIVGKRAWSYAAQVQRPDFSNEYITELLKEQHRAIVAGIREGRLATVLGDESEVADAGGARSIKCLNSDRVYTDVALEVQFCVTLRGAAVEGANVRCAVGVAPRPEISADAVTGPGGIAEFRLPVERIVPGDIALMVRATHGDLSVTRKLRLRRSG